VTSVLGAIHEAWAALVRAGVRSAAIEVDDGAYLAALWEARPEVRSPRPGTQSAAVWLRESLSASFTIDPIPETLGPVRQIYVTPEQEREFRWHGITIRREFQEKKP